MSKPAMKIEAGKKYLTRNGLKAEVGAIKLRARPFERALGWIGQDKYSWSLSGKAGKFPVWSDLVSEVKDV